MNKRTILPVLIATLWISVSEFARNEFLLKELWIKHYQSMGLVFPAEPVNGLIWGIWSFCFALAVFVISRRFTLWETTALAFLVGFLMMWLVIGNMKVLPLGILPVAIPLSILEAFIASWIVRKFQKGL